MDVALAQLRRNKRITVWHDRKILPGQEWDSEIDRKLETASIILLLVSPHFSRAIMLIVVRFSAPWNGTGLAQQRWFRSL